MIGSKDVIDLCRVLRHTFAIQGCPEETECIRVFSAKITEDSAFDNTEVSLKSLQYTTLTF